MVQGNINTELYPIAEQASRINDHRTVASPDSLMRVSVQLEGLADYLRHHKDRDMARLIITEPGRGSALGEEIDRRSPLPQMRF
jgi:hypothetical protein